MAMQSISISDVNQVRIAPEPNWEVAIDLNTICYPPGESTLVMTADTARKLAGQINARLAEPLKPGVDDATLLRWLASRANRRRVAHGDVPWDEGLMAEWCQRQLELARNGGAFTASELAVEKAADEAEAGA